MVSAPLDVDGSQVEAMDGVVRLEQHVAEFPCHHFILVCQLGLLGQQASNQRIDSTCRGTPGGRPSARNRVRAS